jgi:hypothetical protein
MLYRPPGSILEVLQKIEYEEALKPDDPRYVETTRARGSEKTLRRLARKFGLDLESGAFLPATARHVLFFGHIGSGKTTELRHYTKALDAPGRYLVVEVDVTLRLDRNNLQYADVLMAMAAVLLEKLRDNGVSLGPDALKRLEDWFDERVLTSEEAKKFSAEIETGVEIRTGLPYLLDLFAKFTTAFKANATYKDSLRHVVRNAYTDFAVAFNALLRSAETALAKSGRARRILFMVDGTDKLRITDTKNLFIFDAEQLLAIDAHVLYTAPLHLKYEGNLSGKIDSDLVLPMIKPVERDGILFAPGQEAMRGILLNRAAPSLFRSEAEIMRLIEHCGGHPRELLRLLRLCCEFVDGDVIDEPTVDRAVKQLASDYRRFLEPADYALLAMIDADTVHAGNDERTRKLLYNLALLEYNDASWRRSHPVVRTLEGYEQARLARLVPKSRQH